MNYIYDILVNFKYPLLEFYEWNNTDTIENIKKIPFYKVSSKDLNNFKYNKFKIKNVEEILNGTKLFNNKKKYNSLVYTDGIEAYVFNFDDNGICIAKSDLLLDEELEIIESSNLVNITEIDYEIISRDNLDLYKTRNEVNITNFIINEINKTNNIDKLNYIYYECFGNYNQISKDKLLYTIKETWDDKYYKIYDFFKSISMNKD